MGQDEAGVLQPWAITGRVSVRVWVGALGQIGACRMGISRGPGVAGSYCSSKGLHFAWGFPGGFQKQDGGSKEDLLGI